MDCACRGLPADTWVLFDLPALAWGELLRRVQRPEVSPGQPGSAFFAATSGGRDAPARGPATRAAHTDSEGAVRLRYRLDPEALRALAQASPASFAGFAAPYRAADHAFLRGSFVFAVPRAGRVDVAGVRARLPRRWTLVAPWSQMGDGWKPEGVSDLIDNYALAGDLDRVAAITSSGLQWTLVSSKQADWPRGILVPALTGALDDADRLFRHLQADRFLWVLRDRLPQEALEGLAGASSAQAAWGDDGARLAQTLLHEYVHTWLPGALRYPRPSAGRRADGWLTEGFTDWLALRLLGTSGALPPERAAAGLVALQASVAELDRASAPRSLVQAGLDFAVDPLARQLSYRGGALFAAWLDLAMARDGGDDAFLRFLPELVAGLADPEDPAAFLEVLGRCHGALVDEAERYLLTAERPALGPLLASLQESERAAWWGVIVPCLNPACDPGRERRPTGCSSAPPGDR